jgi:hypothetical protein
MPTLNDVYQKFGFASEAAQLLETELGTLLFVSGVVKFNIAESEDPSDAKELLDSVNRQTLGQLLRGLKKESSSLDHFEHVLSKALEERNRLAHSFYRQHNFRRNSEAGRKIMIDDLEGIHEALLEAYKAVMLLSGVDLEKMSLSKLPSGHVPL